MAQCGVGWTAVPCHRRIGPLLVRAPSGLLESQVITARRSESRRAHEGSIPIARPQLGPEEESAVLEVMRSGVLTQGERTRAFEQEFAKSMGARHGVATCNGSVALHLALLAHGIGPGDEVITSPFTFIASVNTILFTGATPVFADIEEGTFNIDPHWVEAAITPRTKALMPVHLYGQPCDMDEITAIADK